MLMEVSSGGLQDQYICRWPGVAEEQEWTLCLPAPQKIHQAELDQEVCCSAQETSAAETVTTAGLRCSAVPHRESAWPTVFWSLPQLIYFFLSFLLKSFW